MTIPRWIAVIGIIECVLGVWGLYMASTVARQASAHSVTALVTIALLAMLSLGSLRAGALLTKRDSRGLRPSLWVLALQSVRLVMPGFVWLLALGWSVIVVLYSGGRPEPDGLELWVMLGHNDRPGYLAVNLLSLVPLAALGLWWRAAVIASRTSKDPEAAA
jgi:hypothetical protein